MKKLFAILLILGFCLSATWATTTMTSGRSGKTMVGINYLTWGYFNKASSEAGTITTGLKTISAFGVNITSEADFPSPLKTTVSGGTITVTATQEVFTPKDPYTPEASSTPSGLWWSIGK